MSRRSINADGTISVQSMSYFGQGDADEHFRKEWAEIHEFNRKALEVWNALTDEERAERTKKFEEERADTNWNIPAFLRKY